MPSPRAPTGRSTRPSRKAATASSDTAPGSPRGRSQRELPELADEFVAEARVPLLSHPPETALLVDRARRGEIRLRPEHELAVALGARKGDAFFDQPPAEPAAARRGLDDQQAQLGGRSRLLDDEHRADALAAALGDPAALARRIEVLDEPGDDPGHQRLEALVPAVFLGVERAVPLHHPAQVAGTMFAQQDLRIFFFST